ncbi:MAG: glycosyltransferase [Gammaproteobacteria bacterium]
MLAVIGGLGVGGTERQLLSVYAGLDRQRFEPAIFVLKQGAALEDEARSAGIDVLHADRVPNGVLGLWHSALALRRTLRTWRPAIVHFMLPEAYLVGAPVCLLSSSARRVMSRRSLRLYQRRYPGAALVERCLHRAMHAVVANSRAVAGELVEEGVAATQLALIYNGVAASALPPRAVARARLGLPEDAFVLVVVANLIPYKGHADLIHALTRARLPRSWHLLCCGRDDGVGADLAAQAQACGVAEKITWCGLVDDPRPMLAAADLAVLPSHQEGFSNALLEAMAAGLAVIATDVGGNGEALGGVAGRLVPPCDPASLARAIAELAADAGARARLGRAGLARVAEHFAQDACVARYERLYDWLTSGAGQPVPVELRPR